MDETIIDSTLFEAFHNTRYVQHPAASRIILLTTTLFILFALAAPPSVQSQEAAGGAPEVVYDLLISGGRIVDGTGSPWVAGDVAITGDRIAAVGRLPNHGSHDPAKDGDPSSRKDGGPGSANDVDRRGQETGPRLAARDTIDASGLVVAPGFIDMLGHSEFRLLANGGALLEADAGDHDRDHGRGDERGARQRAPAGRTPA